MNQADMCQHPPESVVADIMEGEATYGVRWCRICGAYQRHNSPFWISPYQIHRPLNMPENREAQIEAAINGPDIGDEPLPLPTNNAYAFVRDISDLVTIRSPLHTDAIARRFDVWFSIVHSSIVKENEVLVGKLNDVFSLIHDGDIDWDDTVDELLELFQGWGVGR